MAAIGLAAAVLEERHDDVVVGSFAADQVITGRAAFESSVREAVEAARAGYVVTIGIAASRPSTAFGYVHSGAPLGVAGAPSAQHVRGFTEKPDAGTAQRYLASGEYRWNAGMFIVRSSVLLGHLAATSAPSCTTACARSRPRGTAPTATACSRSGGPRSSGSRSTTRWPSRSPRSGASPSSPARSGGTTWATSTPWPPSSRPSTGQGPRCSATTARVVRRESAGSVVVPASDRVVTVLGLDDVVVVDTPDALLVTTRARAQQVKSMGRHGARARDGRAPVSADVTLAARIGAAVARHVDEVVAIRRDIHAHPEVFCAPVARTADERRCSPSRLRAAGLEAWAPARHGPRCATSAAPQPGDAVAAGSPDGAR